MRIGVFTKTEMCGGSEIRAAEICNGLATLTQHASLFLTEGTIPITLSARILPSVRIVEKLFCSPSGRDVLYGLDVLLVINTDSREFTTRAYWEGRSGRHDLRIDLGRIRRMVFLFNFIVSPSASLDEIHALCNDVRIIVANHRFLAEIGRDRRYERVRQLPRIMLESPIDPASVTTEKIRSSHIRIGKHSHALKCKFNESHKELIETLNGRHPGRIIWDFMGVPSDRERELSKFPNVICRPTFSIPVRDYLQGIDVFLFFISWTRQEPWSRSVAEAMMSGCAVVATDADGGNRDQIVNGSNGVLCRNVKDFADAITTLIEDPSRLQSMSKNSILYSKQYRTVEVLSRLTRFLGDLDGSHSVTA